VLAVNTNTSSMPRKDLSFQRLKTTKGKAKLQNVTATLTKKYTRNKVIR
jgi:hypothetical protein